MNCYVNGLRDHQAVLNLELAKPAPKCIATLRPITIVASAASGAPLHGIPDTWLLACSPTVTIASDGSRSSSCSPRVASQEQL